MTAGFVSDEARIEASLRTNARFSKMIDKIDGFGLILLELWQNPCLLEHFRQNCCLLRQVLGHNSVADCVILV